MLRSEHPIANKVIEQRASELLRRYFARFPPPILPVPVERLAEEVCELQISWEPISADLSGIVLGALRAHRRQLVLNDHAQRHFSEFPGSDSFTVAHEIGHWILHVREAPADRELFEDLESSAIAVCTSGSDKPLRERQADRFASYLLMPADLVRTEVTRVAPRDWPALYRLREGLGVSISALCYRLDELGILTVTNGAIDYHP